MAERQPRSFIPRVENLRLALDRTQRVFVLLGTRSSQVMWEDHLPDERVITRSATLGSNYDPSQFAGERRMQSVRNRSYAREQVITKTLPNLSELERKARIAETIETITCFLDIKRQYEERSPYITEDIYAWAKEQLPHVVEYYLPPETRFNEFFIACRLATGQTQDELAQRSEVARFTIIRLENEPQKPHASTLLKIATTGFDWTEDHPFTQLLFAISGNNLSEKNKAPALPEIDGVPEKLVQAFTQFQLRAFMALPELSSLPLSNTFGVNAGHVATAITGKVSPTPQDERNAKDHLNQAGNKAAEFGWVVTYHQPTSQSENLYFRTTTEIAQKVEQMKKRKISRTSGRKPALAPPPAGRASGPAPENLSPYKFPNGRELQLSPRSLRLAIALEEHHYPISETSINASSLAGTVFAQEIAAGKMAQAQATGQLTDLISYVRLQWLMQADTFIINETPQIKPGILRKATYFEVSVNRDQPLSEAEERIARAIGGQYHARKHLDLIDLQRDIFGDHGIEVSTQERKPVRPVSAREAMANFASAVVKTMHMEEKPLWWEQLQDLRKSTQPKGLIDCINQVVTALANAESYLLAQQSPPPEPRGVITIHH